MKKRSIYGILAILSMTIIIFDTQTAIKGAQEGIQLCIQTIIPALFPFLILSGIITSAFLGKNISFMYPIRKLCCIPEGTESILLLGFLGGYPIGAQIITQAYNEGSISKNTANRMLGFCSNAGPSFLFGMFSVIFSKQIISWVLWAIHILSALTVGIFLPRESKSICRIQKTKPISIQTALKNAIRTLSLICGWVIVFRIIICLCERWFLWQLPNEIKVIFAGLLELSNGCISLYKLSDDTVKFIYASGILSFGGLCVAMQTISVTQNLGSGYYFPGKILQTFISLLYSILILPIIFKSTNLSSNILLILGLIIAIIFTIFLIYRKKLWHLKKQCCIIPLKLGQKEQTYAVSKENAKILQLLPTRNRHRRRSNSMHKARDCF